MRDIRRICEKGEPDNLVWLALSVLSIRAYYTDNTVRAAYFVY